MTMNRKFALRQSIRGILAGGLLLGSVSAIQAQEQEAEDSLGLEEVIVTARKKAESLQDTPVAITAIGANMIDELNLRTFEDIAKVTPGLIFDSEFGRSDRPVIRGQGNILGSSGVSYFIDGVYIAGSIDGYDIDDIQQMEVVKGPQSALYGRNTYSGAINIITKSPGDEFSGRVKAVIASDDQYDINATIRGPLGDNWGGSLTVRHFQRDGIWKNIYDGGKLGAQEMDSVSGVLEWNPSDQLRIRARAYYAENDDGHEATQSIPTSANNCYFDDGSLYAGRGRYYCGVIKPVPVDTDWKVQVPLYGGAKGDTLQTSLNIDYEINDVWSLTSVTGYNDSSSVGATDGDYSSTSFQVSNFTPTGFPLVQGPPPWNYGYVGSMIDFTFSNSGERDEWSEELRLSFDSGPWSGMIGAYYYDGSGKFLQNRVLPPNAQAIADANFAAEFARMQTVCGPNPLCTMAIPLFDTSISVSRDQSFSSTQNTAVFGMVEYQFNDDWSVTVEGRYADEKIKSRSLIQNLGGPVLEEETRSASFDSFNPRVTLQWQATDTNMMYLLYAEGNKPGGFNNTFAIEAGYPVYDEETVQSIEFGSKNYFFDNQLVANLALYYNQIKGYQMTQNVQSGVNTSSATVNAGDADVKGLEIEFVYRPEGVDGLTIMTNYAYNDSEFTKGVDENEGVLNDVADDGLVNCSIGDQFPDVPGCTPLFGSIVGKRIPRSAANQFYFDVDYRRPLGDTQWQWFVGANYFYESSKFAQVHNLAKTGDATLVGARLGAQNDRWMFQLWANNLLDEDSVVSIRRYAMPTGFTRNFAMAPRRPTYYGLTATLTF